MSQKANVSGIVARRVSAFCVGRVVLLYSAEDLVGDIQDALCDVDIRDVCQLLDETLFDEGYF